MNLESPHIPGVEQIPIDRPLAVYGTGITALGTVEASGLVPDFWIDDNPSLKGRSLLGKPIYSSDSFPDSGESRPFVIACASTAASSRLVTMRLVQMGYLKRDDFIDCADLHFHSVSNKLSASLGIVSDPRLFERVRACVLNSFLPNLSTTTGTWILSELLLRGHTGRRPRVAVCGVYMGGNAYCSLLATDLWDRCDYHLFDSFEGFGEISIFDPASRKEDFQEANFELVEALFGNLPAVSIHKGFFSETMPEFPQDGLDVIYVDCDLYEPSKYCWEHFEPSIERGGLFLVHDYWVPNASRPLGSTSHFEGVRKAIDEVVDTSVFSILPIPESTHAIIFRK